MAPRKTHKTIERVAGVCTPPEFVVLRHPALGTGVESVILRIPAYSESDTAPGYVPYELLWLAGVILSDNRIDGYLTQGIVPNEAVVDPGTCLGPGDYYFHVGGRDATKAEHYALLRGIQQWKLLDEIIPQGWKEAASWPRREPGHLPNACIISGADEKVQLAHLVPAALHTWLVAQDILQYAQNNRVTRGLETRNASNMVRLYAPLHAMLDDGSWAFFPFPDADAQGTWRFYSMWLRRNDIMANWHHFRPVRGGCEQVTAHTLLARFANNIFLCMQTDHFGLEKERYLWDDSGEARMTSADEIDEWLRKNRESTDPKRRSKSQSPTKRTRSEAHEDRGDDVVGEEEWRFGKECRNSQGTLDSGIGLGPEWNVEDRERDDDESFDSFTDNERKGRFERLDVEVERVGTSCTNLKRARARDCTVIEPSIENNDQERRPGKRRKA